MKVDGRPAMVLQEGDLPPLVGGGASELQALGASLDHRDEVSKLIPSQSMTKNICRQEMRGSTYACCDV